MYKKIFALILFYCFFCFFTTTAFAEVYGYQLKLRAKNQAEVIENGSTLTRENAYLGTELALDVIDPIYNATDFEVSNWDVTLTGYDPDGDKNDNLFTLSSPNKSNSIYASTLFLNKNQCGQGCYAVVNASASVQSHKTNSISFKLFIKDPTPGEALGVINNSNVDVTTDPSQDEAAGIAGNFNADTNKNSNGTPVSASTNEKPHSVQATLEQSAEIAITAAKVVSDQISVASDIIKDSFEAVGIRKESTPQVISAVTGFTTVAVASAAPIANSLSVFSFYELMRAAWYPFASLFVFRRRRTANWGKIVEVGTNMPVAHAKIILRKIEENGAEKIIATTYSDTKGEYGFVASPGNYRLSVYKDSYKIGYPGIGYYYPDSIVEVKDYNHGLVVPAIALTMTEEKIKSSLSVLRQFNSLEKVLTYVSTFFLILGTIVIVDSFIHQKNWFNIMMLSLYVVLWVINLGSFIKKSPWGDVVDLNDLKSLSLVLVRVFDKKSKRLVKTAVTDANGKFSLLVPGGDYEIKTFKSGYLQEEGVDIGTVKDNNIIAQIIRMKKLNSETE